VLRRAATATLAAPLAPLPSDKGTWQNVHNVPGDTESWMTGWSMQSAQIQ
jgi:hypothetical protein